MMERLKKISAIFILCLCFTTISVCAAGVVGNVKDSGSGWTTNYGEKSYTWTSNGTTVYTGVTGSRETLNEGQHYYAGETETTDISISKWVVAHSNMSCIHGMGWTGTAYAGFSYSPNTICGHLLNSGWFGYCADCGEPISAMVDSTPSVVKTITNVSNGYPYAYVCPWCTGINTGFPFEHDCKKDISYNQYFIYYSSNGATSGVTPMTTHMYNNEETYEGELITFHQNLSYCLFEKYGYA